jgi:hypothetical protein
MVVGRDNDVEIEYEEEVGSDEERVYVGANMEEDLSGSR